jgi:hypothetical protein
MASSRWGRERKAKLALIAGMLVACTRTEMPRRIEPARGSCRRHQNAVNWAPPVIIPMAP